jgi:hypothetical protein
MLLAHWLNPCVEQNLNLPNFLRSIDEKRLIETLSRNKLLFKFLQKLNHDTNMENKFFAAFPSLIDISQQINRKISRDTAEFDKIKDAFSENGIDFMLIKSDGSFPYESDNVDVLVKPDRLRDVAKLLGRAGYSELPKMREPHKFLFRKKSAFEVLPLHIHTRVEWEGTQFVDANYLWRRSIVARSDDGFLVPSAEDCVLITVAHLFFENHEVKLYDLFKVCSILKEFELNWHYAVEHSKRLHWNDAFLLTLSLMDWIYINLYSQHLVNTETIEKLDKANYYLYNRFIKAIIAYLSFGKLPTEIPYAVSGFFFLRRVFHDSDASLAERSKHTMWVASEVVKLRINNLGLAISSF